VVKDLKRAKRVPEADPQEDRGRRLFDIFAG
jgi:hypothetical protein